MQEHHVIPLAYGGRADGVTAWICTACHDGVHATAENLTAKTVKPRQFLPLATLERVQPLIGAIIRAKLLFEASGETALHGRNTVSFSAPGNMRQVLQTLRQDAGFTSVSAYLVALIEREARERLGLEITSE